jgi:predicted ester cyclase
MKDVSEFNKLRVRLFIEAVLNEGRLELIDELIAADFIGHIPCAEPPVTGPAGVRQLVSSRRRAHPGLYVKIEDQIAEDDRVATRWRATIPAREAQAPLAPAGRAACYAGISVTRLLAGKQVDSHTAAAGHREWAHLPASTFMFAVVSGTISEPAGAGDQSYR